MEVTKYEQLVEETRALALEYAGQEDWPVVKNSNGVEISVHSVPGNKCKVFKAVGEFDAPPAQLYKYIGFFPGDSDQVKKKIHKIVESWEVLQELSETVYILRTVSKSVGGGIISAREYVDVVGRFVNNSTHMVCATGIDYPYPNDKYTRGFNHCLGLICYPLPGQPHKSKLVYLLHTDLRGKLPNKIVESALPDTQLTYFKSLHKAIKDGVDPS